MRTVPCLLLLPSLVCGIALAQTPGSIDQHQAAPPESQPQPSPGGQRSQRIRIEDAGDRIDELRVGGQTRSIAVQPKGEHMPGYEVQPPDGHRNGSHSGAETTTAPRVWNLLQF